MSDRPDVILLRSADEGSDPYVAAFERAGLHAVCEPVLEFAFPNQSALRERLEDLDRFEALVATSPRVATALERLFRDEEHLAQKLRDTTTYSVGPKTAARLRDVGLQPRGEEAGDAETLANRIIEDDPTAPLLFLCGNRRRETLPNRFREADVPFEELVVYETRIRQDLTLPPSNESMWLVFFSPSGLETVEASAVNLSTFRLAAIGPTTAGALEDAGHSVEAVATEPSPDGLVSAILVAEEDA